VEAPSDGGRGGALAIDQCVEDVLAVLLHQVVDVSKNSAGSLISRCPAAAPRAGQLDLPHGELGRIVARGWEAIVGDDGNWRRRAVYRGGCRWQKRGEERKSGVDVWLYSHVGQACPTQPLHIRRPLSAASSPLHRGPLLRWRNSQTTDPSFIILLWGCPRHSHHAVPGRPYTHSTPCARAHLLFRHMSGSCLRSEPLPANARAPVPDRPLLFFRAQRCENSNARRCSTLNSCGPAR
jgi:hypothetical protein